jgi:hypothetical protein
MSRPGAELVHMARPQLLIAAVVILRLLVIGRHHATARIHSAGAVRPQLPAAVMSSG